ncbi:Hypothetical protein SCF082_LOCUS4442 [Durusdinium trenchii]|uniref:EF-hand domain-containing protein n=1 Tax=Durusdinium trenchii TaxID=1381693 RepID=A0ABP0I2W7_9DINO
MNMDVDATILELQDFSRQRRLRWEALFKDFDNHKSKHIAESLFRRGLEASKAGLSESEIDTLVETFRSRGQVNYQAFCDRVNQVFAPTGLETDPTRKVTAVLPVGVNRHYHAAKNLLSANEEEQLQHTLSVLADKVRTECIVLKSFFGDFDRIGNGFVTKNQFMRGMFSMLSGRDPSLEERSRILVKAYEDPRGDVNFRRFCNDVDTLAAQPRAQEANHSSSARLTKPSSSNEGFSDALDVEQTLAAMRRVQQSDGLRLHHFFTDMDKMRKGLITRAQFQTALATAFQKKVFLDASLFGRLCDRYTAITSITPSKSLEHERVVRYGEFIDEIDQTSAHLRDLHLDPRKEADVGPSTSGPAALGAWSEQDESDTEVAALLSRTQAVIRTRRLHVKPIFRDFDRLNRGVVSDEQFKRVLKQELQILGFSERELDLLVGRFSKGRGNGVSYVDFVNVIEAHGTSAVSPSRSSVFPKTALQKLNSTRTVELDRASVLARLQDKIKSQRIRLREFLEDSDRFKHGTITIANCIQGFSRARLDFSSQEVEALVEPYIANQNDTACSPQLRKVQWRRFLQEVELVEVTPGLERNPQHPGTTHTRSIKGPQGDHLDAESARVLEQWLSQLKSEIKTNRVLMQPSFAIHDKHNSGKLPRPLFRRALDSINLKSLRDVTEDTVDLLCQQFAHNPAANGIDQVNYRAFLMVVDPKENHVASGSGIAMVHLAQAKDDERKLEQAKARAAESASPRAFPGPELDTSDRMVELMRSLQDECWTKRIRIKEFLQDFDPLRKGRIPASKFKSALPMAGIKSVQGVEIDLIARAFMDRSEPNTVAYLPFVHAIDGGDERLEANPLDEAKVKAGRGFDERRPRQVSSEELEQVMHPLRQACRARRISLSDAFQRFDKQNMKAVTGSQFLAVLKTNDLLPLHDVERTFDVLKRGFPAVHAEKVNYLSFLRELGQL